jgi:hypothetical protein
VQFANVSHVDVVSLSEQGWPSGMTVGHVPLVALPVVGQLPTRHWVVSLHG